MIEYKDNYFCDMQGNIYSKKRGKLKLLRYEVLKGGYYRVALTINNVRIKKLVHRIVAECYIKSIPGKPIINHIDGNKTNNNAYNLEWCTYSENLKHAYTILKRNGPASKLTLEDRIKIKELMASGERQIDVAKKFNVVHSTISNVINNKTYQNQ